MNAKKVKAIRQSLKRAGVNWREKDYVIGRAVSFFIGHVTLEQACGRAKYKWVKANAA